jgi:hypothetical protein
MGHGPPGLPHDAVKNVAFVIGWALTMALVSGRVLFADDGAVPGRLPLGVVLLFLFAMWACVLIGLPLLLRGRRRRRRAAAPRDRAKRRRRLQDAARTAAEGTPSGPP